MTDSHDPRSRPIPKFTPGALTPEIPASWDDELDSDDGPYLDCLMRKSVPRIPSFPRLLVPDAADADFEGLPTHYWRVPYELQPDYVAIIGRGPFKDEWVDLKVINLEFVDYWREQRANRTAKRHRHGILGNMEENVYLIQVVLAVGSKIHDPGVVGAVTQTKMAIPSV